MPQTQRAGREPETSQIHPWYRYPWPWVAIGIPATAVFGGLFTLYLAITHPDPLVVDDEQYRELRSGLVAEPLAEPLVEPLADPGTAASAAAPETRNDPDGDL